MVIEDTECDQEQRKNVHRGYKAENGFSLTVPHLNRHIGLELVVRKRC